MGAIRFGPAFVPSREDPEAALEVLLAPDYSACEVDFEGGFWMDWDYAERLGELARQADVALSVHAPIPAFLGHRQRSKKYRMAVGMLDHSAGSPGRAAPCWWSSTRGSCSGASATRRWLRLWSS